MPTKDYPYLAFWKAHCLNQFPVIPPEELLRPHQEQAVKEFYKSSEFASIVDPVTQVIYELEVKKRTADSIMAHLEKKAAQTLLEEGIKSVQAQKDARLKGEKFSINPPAGGGVDFSNNELWALKEIYQELQDVIIRARRENDLPLRGNTTPRGAGHIALSPWLANILEENELSLVPISTPSESALTILTRRLKSGLRYNISPRTLKDKLKKFHLPS